MSSDGEGQSHAGTEERTGRNSLFGLDVRLLVATCVMVAAVCCLVISFPWLTSPDTDSLSSDSILHLRLLLVLVFFAALIFLVGATNAKLQLEADPAKTKYSATERQLRRYMEAYGHEIGIALFVAVVVSSLFEFTVRVAESERADREKRELKENVFQAVFGRTIDPSVIQEVMESVLESHLTRRNLEINCHLYRADKTQKSVSVRVEMKYHLQNALSKTVVLGGNSTALKMDESHEGQLRHAILRLEPSDPNTDRFTSFAVSDEQLKPIAFLGETHLKDLRAQAIEDFKKPQKQDTLAAAIARGQEPGALGGDAEKLGMAISKSPTPVEGFEYHYGARQQQVAITRLEIPPGKAVVVDFSYEQTKREADTLDIFTPLPTTNFEFTVSKGEGAGDLHIDVQSTHRHQPVRLVPNIQQEGPGETYIYQIKAALLPGQVVEVGWCPASPKVAKHESGNGKAAGQ